MSVGDAAVAVELGCTVELGTRVGELTAVFVAGASVGAAWQALTKIKVRKIAPIIFFIQLL